MEQQKTETHFYRLYREFEYKLDTQRRIAVPAEWRAENPCGIFMMIPARDNMIQMYPDEVFTKKFAEKLAKLSMGSAEDMRKARDFGANVYKCVCDSQGRIQMPKELLAWGKVDSRLAMIGAGDFAQLMSAERREAEKAQAQAAGEPSFLDILSL